MFNAAFILAAFAALGLGTWSAAQDNRDEQYWSVTGDSGPWYLQRSRCTLAHNASNGAENESDCGVLVVWFRMPMAGEIEFVDRRLRGISNGEEVELVVTLDGAPRDVSRALSRRGMGGADAGQHD